MNWLIGGPQGEAKKLIAQLADGEKCEAAARELINFGVDAVPALIDALQTQDSNLLPVYEQILARIPSASPHLIKTLGSAHPILRGRAAEVFSISKDETAIPALLEALKGEYYTVRSRAALALGNIGNANVISALLPLLKDQEDEVRIAACTAVGKFCDPPTFDEITNVLLDDSKIEVRQSAAKALGETKHPVAIPFLMEALHDSYWWYEKEQAVLVLLNAIEMMGSAVVEPLIEALGDHEVTVRKLAAMVLGNLRDSRAMEELSMAVYDLHDEVSQSAAEALAKFGAPAVGVLGEALRHPEATVREHAVIGLGRIQDARVAPLLIGMLNDPERTVRKQSMQSLGKLNDERAASALKEIASNRADRKMSALAKQILEAMK
ncbi:MAG: HEAT repeat domain-containing protein [Anaerolineales bacterium]